VDGRSLIEPRRRDEKSSSGGRMPAGLAVTSSQVRAVV
jgi:hypothetical protein